MTALPCRYGPLLVPDRPDLVFNSLRAYGEWAQAELDLLARFIRPGDTVVDAGAFIGTHARAFSAMVGAHGQVHAFEPNAESHAVLAGNAALAPQANISTYQVALGREPRSAGLVVSADTAGNAGATHLVNEPVGSASTVTVSCLDAFPWPRLDLVKADVEGMEHDVLLGAEATIRRHRPLLFLEINTLHSAGALIAWAQARDYLVFGVLSPAFNPDNFKGASVNLFGTAGECGLLLISRSRQDQWLDTLAALNLPLLTTLDDLALLLLHKPQYVHEALSTTSVFAVLGGDFPTPALVERDARIAALQQEVLHRDGQIAGLQEEALQRDGYIATLDRAVVERDGQIAALQREALQRDGYIATLERTVAERDGELAELRQALAERAGEVAALRQDLALRDADIAALRHALSASGDRIYTLDQALLERNRLFAELVNSRSWRLTNPLRQAGHNLRRAVGTVDRLIVRNCAKVPRTYRDHGFSGLCLKVSRKLRGPVPPAAGAPPAPPPDLDLAACLPAPPCVNTPLPAVTVDVIVPVYRGYEFTRRCLESLRAASCHTPMRVIVINDASPEPQVTALLDELARTGDELFLANDRNLGFVATVNRGMALSTANDVLLLNSDTEVTDGWLDRLAVHAYSAPDVGTVTPFSNNATICSYPVVEGVRTLPPGETLTSLDQAFAQANGGRSVELPTAVGFCMYIRRACLNAVGLFDEQAFGKGYGEENDFCLRATAAGWRHLLAADTYVFHAGEVSFQGESTPAKAAAMEIIRQRYPDYERQVMAHLLKDPAGPCRVAATAARYRLSGKPVTLIIGHHYGGGAERHWLEQIAANAGRSYALVLKPCGDDSVELSAPDPHAALRLTISFPSQRDLLRDILRSCGLTGIHIHHLLGVPWPVLDLCRELQLPWDVTVHDYFMLCPRINLIDAAGCYCGEPDAAACNRCLAERGNSFQATDIVAWRQRYATVLHAARTVFVPDADVATRLARYYPQLPMTVAPLESPPPAIPAAVPLVVPPGERLRIVTIGAIGQIKGYDVLLACAHDARRRGLPIDFTVLGYSMDDELLVNAGIHVTGRYDEPDALLRLRDLNPHLVWLPSLCPETYCYTLTIALAAGFPVAAFDLGAIAARLRRLGRADYLLPLGMAAHSSALNDYFIAQSRP